MVLRVPSQRTDLTGQRKHKPHRKGCASMILRKPALKAGLDLIKTDTWENHQENEIHQG